MSLKFFKVGERCRNRKDWYEVLEIKGKQMKVRYESDGSEDMLDIDMQKRIYENMPFDEPTSYKRQDGVSEMTISSFVATLKGADRNFFASAGNYENRVHIRHNNTPTIPIQSKSRRGLYNNCHVVFAHLYEDPQTKDLFWFKKATNSQHVRGHKCIAEIFDALTSAEEKIESKKAKKILGSEIEEVLEHLKLINKCNIVPADIDDR